MISENNDNTKDMLFKLGIMLAVILALLGYYTYTQVFGGSTIGKTLTSNPDLENGLVGHWTFDGNLNTRVTDESGNGNHGKITGVATSSAVIAGKIGQAITTDGIDDVVGSGDAALLKPNLPLSTAGWVYFDTLSGTQPLWGTRTTIEPHNGYWVDISSSGAIGVNYGDNTTCGPAGRRTKVSLQTLVTGGWHHIVAVIRGATDMSIYIDGQDAGGTYSGSGGTLTYIAGVAFRVGQQGGSGGCAQLYARGKYDDVRVYNRALSAEEVSRLYELGATTKIAKTINTNPDLENGLVGHWTFDGEDMDWSSTTAEARDRSNGNKAGDVTNFDSSSAKAGVIGQALEFDGTDDFIAVSGGDGSSYDPATENFTVAAWVYSTSVDGDGAHNIISAGDAGLTDNYSLAISDTTNAVRFDFTTGSPNHTATANSGVDIRGAGWHHVVGVRTGQKSAAIYVDGVLRGTGSHVQSTTAVDISSALTIGKFYNDTNRFKGLLDDVRYYNRALSAEEISRIHELGATTHIGTTITPEGSLDQGLVGHWTFDGEDMQWSSTTAEVRDVSGNGSHLDITGFDSSSVQLGKLGQSLYLDGVNDEIDGLATYNALESSLPLTVSGWFKLTTTISDNVPLVMYRSTSGSRYDGHWSTIGSTLGVTVNFGDDTISCAGGGRRTKSTGASVVAVGQWFHYIAVIRGAGDMSIYINGTDVGGTYGGSAAGTIAYSATAALEFGRGAVGSGCGIQRFTGNIDDIRLYNRALSADEARRLYELGK